MPLTTAKNKDTVASRHGPTARKARAFHWQLPTGNWQLPRPRGFTLVEMLVVMAIIVLAVTMAVPAIKFLTGTRSEESARNTLSSYIGFARNDAVGLQQVRGAMFFLDDDDRVKCIEVMQVQPDPTLLPQAGVVYLDVVPDRDTLSLPAGVRVWTLKEEMSPTGFTSPFDGYRYLGFNNDYVGGQQANEKNGTVRIGGVILFGPDGRLLSTRYGFVFLQGGNLTALGSLVAAQGTNALWPTTGNSSSHYLSSQIGLVMMDKEAFYTGTGVQGGDGNLDVGVKPSNEWLDANTTPVFVNRYSGTLMQAE